MLDMNRVLTITGLEPECGVFHLLNLAYKSNGLSDEVGEVFLATERVRLAVNLLDVFS